MVFHSNKAIFFHVPKTAGYAMEQYFAPGCMDYKVFDPVCLFGLKNGAMAQHYPYSEMIKIVPPDIMKNYFKFAFVRNPWDRLVSAYSYLKTKHDELHGGFEGWLGHVCSRVRSRDYQPGAHHAPQTDYLLHEGAAVLDFVGRYENLQQDFATVCIRLQAPVGRLPVQNKSSLRTGHYRGYYSPAMAELVAGTYAEEIALLGYSFEEVPQPQTPEGMTSARTTS